MTDDKNWKRAFVEQGGNCDSDRQVICPLCGCKFDGETHEFEAGEEECPDCDHVFEVNVICD